MEAINETTPGADLSAIRLHMLGCGRMGSAMLKRWLDQGLPPRTTTVSDPFPSDWLKRQCGTGLSLATTPDEPPDVVVVATKPQYVAEALSPLARFGDGETVFVSIAAATPLAELKMVLGEKTPVMRAMPNVAAEIGSGVVGTISQNGENTPLFSVALRLLAALGRIVPLESEEQMHALTAVSGSGPAYIFAMTTAMEQAAIKLGLPASSARALAIHTILGSARLMADGASTPNELRDTVCSPGGTTEAGLSVLLREGAGLTELVEETIRAAAVRSAELANGS